MEFFYSATTKGFYNESVHESIPQDAVAITEQEWQALLDGQSNGQEIYSDGVNKPALRDVTYTDDELSAQVRSKRDGLLKQSDYTQVSDSPLDGAAWAAYRVLLRDIPEQVGFPTSVVWPDEPL